MNIFSSLRIYAGNWQKKAERFFTQEEKDAVESCSVVSSQYGNSACFLMKGGGMAFIPMSNGSSLGVGDTVDLDRAKIITLARQGDNDIQRIEL